MARVAQTDAGVFSYADSYLWKVLFHVEQIVASGGICSTWNIWI